MKKRIAMNIVILELIIVVLFFALSAGVALRLFAAADAGSRRSSIESAALSAMQAMAEELKAAPEGTFIDGRREVGRTLDELELNAVITRKDRPAGAYYEIVITASHAGEEVDTLTAGRYVREEAP